MSQPTISVIITTFNDRKRVPRTFKSLLSQSLHPTEIIFADGGSTDGTVQLAKHLEKKRAFVKYVNAPGNIAETRRQVLAKLTSDIIAFIDADEIAHDKWLASLVTPIVEGKADFTGGPTKQAGKAKSKIEQYLNDYDDWFYENVVPNDIAMLPMGNSAWKREIFVKIGGINEYLKFNAEDYDINQRAVREGYKGMLVQDAWLYHDQSNVNTMRKLLKRKYRYNTGAAYTYLKNKTLFKKMKRAAKPVTQFKHRYQLLDVIIKPIALLRAIILYYTGR